MCLAGWLQREQQQVIEFYQAQLEAMLQAQGKKRIILTDDQRRVLAVKGKLLGRKALTELTTIVTPDTILRWHDRIQTLANLGHEIADQTVGNILKATASSRQPIANPKPRGRRFWPHIVSRRFVLFRAHCSPLAPQLD